LHDEDFAPVSFSSQIQAFLAYLDIALVSDGPWQMKFVSTRQFGLCMHVSAVKRQDSRFVSTNQLHLVSLMSDSLIRMM